MRVCGLRFLFVLPGDVNGALTLHAHNIIEAMAWVVLALGAKKTPVAPHLVFAVGWIAECVGKTLGQLVAPLLAGDPLVLMAVVVMLVLLGVGFAFSEGYNLLDIDDEEEGRSPRNRARRGCRRCECERSPRGPFRRGRGGRSSCGCIRNSSFSPVSFRAQRRRRGVDGSSR
ncbi:MAG: hypothetical protein ACLTDR_14600 [Adlercreutzia equolifaciens]